MSNTETEDRKVVDKSSLHDELFAAAVAAAKEAGWGIPQNHQKLLEALSNMAIPQSNL